MQMSDHVLMITQLDLPCLRNVVRMMMTFDEDPDLREKVKVVVNRQGQESGQISYKKAQETIGREIFWQIPNDYRVMAEVRNNGVSLLEHAPKAGITHSLGQLADTLCGNLSEAEAEEKRESKGRRWLGLWQSK